MSVRRTTAPEKWAKGQDSGRESNTLEIGHIGHLFKEASGKAGRKEYSHSGDESHLG